jgi:hypothetical protein
VKVTDVFLVVLSIAVITAGIFMWMYMDAHTCQLTAHCLGELQRYRVNSRM